MYLKEIEVSGFKSFADKLNFKLDNNITCIVGPNGSGKSNVVDAVRWVLGEQSVKSLRGDGNMSDVIFSGSKSRNASNVASVTLIFDNSDHYLQLPYTEVSIKRRIYRTGENEYFLNGEKCRLKDVTDLLMDSGIGKESFNIISQGEVMRILSTSPQDRRIIFEEAAGVTKYKKRKDEALRKLDRTNQNMERVEDIINELESQVKPLEEQSKKAKQYLEAHEKLEKIEVALLASEITTINEENTQSKRRVESLQKEITSLSANSSLSGSNVDTKRLELLKLENAYKEENERLLTLTKEAEKLYGEKRILQERSKYNASDAKIHENLVTLKERKLALDNDISSIKQQLENDQYLQQEALNDLRKQESEVETSRKRKEDYLREYNQKSREYLELKNKINVLENNIENGSAFSSSVRAVLNNPRLVGIHDCFSNILEADSKFAKALDVALSSSKQSIVVENEFAAQSAIDYLKTQKLGRATFFPLNTMRPRYIDPDTQALLRGQAGYIDTFQNLVKYNPIYDSVVSNQLGNVLVAIDFQSATQIAKTIHHRYRIVTLDGEVMNVGGSIAGGSTTSTKSILFMKQEHDQLILQKKNLKTTILELEASLKDLENTRNKQEENLYQKKQEILEKNEIVKNHIASLQEKTDSLEEITREISSLEHVIDSSIQPEEERIMEAYSLKVNEKNTSLHTLEKLTLQKDRLSREIEELEAKNKMANADLRKLEQEEKELSIQIGKYDLKLDHYLEILNEEYSMTYEKAKNEYPLELEVEEARDQVTLYKSILKKIGMVNVDSIEEYERVHERYTFLLNQKEDLRHAKESLYEIIGEMDDVMQRELKETFGLVRKEFQEVFKKLFGGGTADLKLTDPNNVLETGVEIIASPPGKKLTTITLLSGGEKTLAAISLLFAILNVRTVPFCLFDEVEAALDDANVDNFGTYLNSYKDKTQFLLITHKKKTMEYAKTLYGITMQESGVSKLVSVQFEKLEKIDTL